MQPRDDTIITYIPKDDIDLMILLPKYFQEIYEFQEIMSTEEIELKEFFLILQQVWNNLFLQTMDENTIEYHEDLLGLTPDPSDSLELRRWRVIQRYLRRPPFTLGILHEQLNNLLGLGAYTLTVDYANKTVTLDFINVEESLRLEAIAILITLPPAHLGYTYSTTTQPESNANIGVGGKLVTNWIFDLP